MQDSHGLPIVVGGLLVLLGLAATALFEIPATRGDTGVWVGLGLGASLFAVVAIAHALNRRQ